MLHDLLHYQMQIHQYHRDVTSQILELPFQLSNFKSNYKILINKTMNEYNSVTCLIKSSVFHHPSRLTPGFIMTHASSSNFKRPSTSVRDY